MAQAKFTLAIIFRNVGKFSNNQLIKQKISKLGVIFYFQKVDTVIVILMMMWTMFQP